jgi:hypothetical protein
VILALSALVYVLALRQRLPVEQAEQNRDDTVAEAEIDGHELDGGRTAGTRTRSRSGS